MVGIDKCAFKKRAYFVERYSSKLTIEASLLRSVRRRCAPVPVFLATSIGFDHLKCGIDRITSSAYSWIRLNYLHLLLTALQGFDLNHCVLCIYGTKTACIDTFDKPTFYVMRFMRDV